MTPNRLGLEKSPYLLQHKDNPVAWFAWGDEAFEAARREQKPIFLSIGYSTCYWCHVMEKDSFERQEVADVLNANFIAVKVDREERPDVDQLYMQAVMSLTGHGGWPMSVFLTPALEPFWGGTFFYRDQFIQILNRVHEVWGNERDKVQASAQAISQFLREHDSDFDAAEINEDALRASLQAYSENFDALHGGFGAAPKFPPSAQVSLLLRLFRRFHDARAKEMAITTLAAMARGGIYDHIGGGFSRYSTDERWLVPHFEKMLYDNALLASTYLEAAQVFPEPLFSSVAEETLNYLLRDMRSTEGGFFTAEDAGEVGKEGEFYVWKYSELEELLSAPEFAALKEAYRISPDGNFEHNQIILNLAPEFTWEERSRGLLRDALVKLFAARSKRTRPHCDDKILSGWNGLAITALCKGYQVLHRSEYLAAAQQCAHFIRQKMMLSGELLRRYRDGEAKYSAGIEDYAYLIEALTSLYASDFDANWLMWAKQLQEWQDRKFWDADRGGYFFSDSKELLQRRKEFIDGATPSGNSVAALNCLRLHAYFGERSYLERATAILKAASGGIARYPTAFPKALQALDFMLDRGKEIVIIRSAVDKISAPLTTFLFETFLPNDVWMIEGEASAANSPLPLVKGKTVVDGKTTVYICEQQVCQLPLTDIDQIRTQIAPTVLK